MPKVSVIIPVYNVREYLRQCIESVINQSYNNLEIILVNDGSLDDSGMICDEYSMTDKRVLSIHKENGGLSDARNKGMAIASGEYIYFLDSDDWIAPNAIETLVHYAIEHNCELVQGGFYYAYDSFLIYDDRKLKDSDSPFILSRPQAMTELTKNEYIKNFAWGKLYKATIIKRHPFKVGVYFEDSYWQHLIIDNISNYGVIPTPLYYYRQRENSISGAFNLNFIDLLKGTEEKLLFIKAGYPKLAKAITVFYWNLICDTYYNALRTKDTNIITAINDYLCHAQDCYKNDFNKHLSLNAKYIISQKCRFLLSSYYMCIRVFNRIFTPKLKRIDVK